MESPKRNRKALSFVYGGGRSLYTNVVLEKQWNFQVCSTELAARDLVYDLVCLYKGTLISFRDEETGFHKGKELQHGLLEFIVLVSISVI